VRVSRVCSCRQNPCSSVCCNLRVLEPSGIFDSEGGDSSWRVGVTWGVFQELEYRYNLTTASTDILVFTGSLETEIDSFPFLTVFQSLRLLGERVPRATETCVWYRGTSSSSDGSFPLSTSWLNSDLISSVGLVNTLLTGTLLNGSTTSGLGGVGLLDLEAVGLNNETALAGFGFSNVSAVEVVLSLDPDSSIDDCGRAGYVAVHDSAGEGSFYGWLSGSLNPFFGAFDVTLDRSQAALVELEPGRTDTVRAPHGDGSLYGGHSELP
jgi:hypothetical protein